MSQARHDGPEGGGRRDVEPISPVAAGERAQRDIGASLRAEEALERAHETLQAIVRASPLAIVAVDADTNVDIWNPAAERIFGWTEEEVIGLPYPAVPDDRKDEFHEKFLAARRGEALVTVEAERMRKDGSRFTVRVSTAPLHSARGEFRGVMALFEDVTEQKAAREAQERLHRETRRAVRLRDEVLRVVAHDLRDPLSTISLSAGLIRETLEDGRVADRGLASKQLGVIERTVHRANRLIRDLLDVARMEAGPLPLRVAPQETAALIRETCEAHVRLAREKEIAIEHHAPSHLPPVLADRDRVLQVFGNLVGNAVKFTGKGGRVMLGAEQRDGEVVFSVSDTGPGIPEEERAHLFDAFWQAAAGKAEGAGLGLAISRGIVEAHGGGIWVESDVGEGTTVQFGLPIATGEEESYSGVRDASAVK